MAKVIIDLVRVGLGFLCSHLIDRLMMQGEEVIYLDKAYTIRKSNLINWCDNPFFEFIRHDVKATIRLEVDRIWYLVFPASPIQYQFKPIKAAKKELSWEPIKHLNIRLDKTINYFKEELNLKNN
tara:strand:- start:77 stop:451 length:375 start_codon:yes stop_codon:yes gene_type:complete